MKIANKEKAKKKSSNEKFSTPNSHQKKKEIEGRVRKVWKWKLN